MEQISEKARLIPIVPAAEEQEKRDEIQREERPTSRGNQALYVNITQF